MEELLLTAVFFSVLFFLLGSGIWVGLSLVGVAMVGMWLFTTRPAFRIASMFSSSVW